MSLRTRKKEQRLGRIRDAAFALFEEHGYAATTMEQIAERAEVSVGTLYNYFGAKADLLADALKSLMMGAMGDMEAFMQMAEGTPADRLTDLWIGAFEQLPMSRELYSELYAAVLTQQDRMQPMFDELVAYSHGFMRSVLEKCVKDGVLDRDVDIDAAVEMIMPMMEGYEISYYMNLIPDLATLREKTHLALTTLFRGMQGGTR